ncbi:hypothetical protein ACFPM0_03790 [Pseudonocardia sulfidoxydans]|uniref:hypothetical protein n=1 Tax=Pseudonocardia sulfidoxydans TaxID=54011 RepID=UPI00361283C9
MSRSSCSSRAPSFSSHSCSPRSAAAPGTHPAAPAPGTPPWRWSTAASRGAVADMRARPGHAADDGSGRAPEPPSPDARRCCRSLGQLPSDGRAVAPEEGTRARRPAAATLTGRGLADTIGLPQGAHVANIRNRNCRRAAGRAPETTFGDTAGQPAATARDCSTASWSTRSFISSPE